MIVASLWWIFCLSLSSSVTVGLGFFSTSPLRTSRSWLSIGWFVLKKRLTDKLICSVQVDSLLYFLRPLQFFILVTLRFTEVKAKVRLDRLGVGLINCDLCTISGDTIKTRVVVFVLCSWRFLTIMSDFVVCLRDRGFPGDQDSFFKYERQVRYKILLRRREFELRLRFRFGWWFRGFLRHRPRWQSQVSTEISLPSFPKDRACFRNDFEVQFADIRLVRKFREVREKDLDLEWVRVFSGRDAQTTADRRSPFSLVENSISFLLNGWQNRYFPL